MTQTNSLQLYKKKRPQSSRKKALDKHETRKTCVVSFSIVIKSIFTLFYRQIESYNKKCRFFKGANSFRVVQSNKPVYKYF